MWRPLVDVRDAARAYIAVLRADEHERRGETCRSELWRQIARSLQEMERRLIENTLEHYDGHRGKTAQALGIGVRTLANKLRSYGYGPRAKISPRAA